MGGKLHVGRSGESGRVWGMVLGDLAYAQASGRKLGESHCANKSSEDRRNAQPQVVGMLSLIEKWWLALLNPAIELW